MNQPHTNCLTCQEMATNGLTVRVRWTHVRWTQTTADDHRYQSTEPPARHNTSATTTDIGALGLQLDNTSATTTEVLTL